MVVCRRNVLLVVVQLLVVDHAGGLGTGGGQTSSISIYQSTSSSVPLAESYSEGACVIPQTSRKLDPKWVVRQSTFYVPIASQFTFRLYAETFLSRAGVSDQDVKSMCLTMDFFPDGPGVNLTNTGYDLREFRLTCPVIWRGQFTCLPVGGSAGTNSARARSTDNYVVSVDNQSYMLVVRCVDGFFKDYMLLTTRPVVSPELYHTVVSIIKELGFDDRKMQLLTYDTCLRTDRFVTAVSVHHHHNHHHHHHNGQTSVLGEDDSSSVRITKSSSSGLLGGIGVASSSGHHHEHHGTVTVGRPISGGALRPSFGTASVHQHHHHRGGGSAKRISVHGGLPITANIVGSIGSGGLDAGGLTISNGGGSGGLPVGGLPIGPIQLETAGGGGSGGRTTKVEEVEAYYAIIP